MAWLLGVAAGAPPDTVPAPELERVVLERTNDLRLDLGVRALREDAALSALARAHSCDMAGRDFFSHRSPANGALDDRMRRAGVRVAVAAENLAAVTGGDPVAVAIQGWLESAGHRATLLGDGYTLTGVGVCRGGRTYYLTQIFARPLAARGG